MTKYYIDNQGYYIGSRDAVEGVEIIAPEGGIEVYTAPEDARQRYLNGEWTDLNTVYTYAEKRLNAYAPIADQLDMMYHDSVNDTCTWKDHIDAVKAAYPKV